MHCVSLPRAANAVEELLRGPPRTAPGHQIASLGGELSAV